METEYHASVTKHDNFFLLSSNTVESLVRKALFLEYLHVLSPKMERLLGADDLLASY